MADRLYTIGYQGAGADDLAEALSAAGVAVLIDVRAAPVSRRREFRKNVLRDFLAARDLAYTHLAGLGNPKAGRDAARAGEKARYLEIFLAQLETDAALADLARAAEIATARPACLMCLERDPAHCHRTIVAERIAERTGLTVTALTAGDPSR